MEHYGQNYGLILYSTTIDAFNGAPMSIKPHKYRDRANVYLDGEWFATFLRDRGATKTAGTSYLFVPNGTKRRVDILLENIGRVNYGPFIPDEQKGLEDCAQCGNTKLFGYETRTLPLCDLSHLLWKKQKHTDHMPCFFKGSFKAVEDVDSFVCFEKFGHGYIWVNGFNLGRFDGAGPQMTLYVPGELLKENNEIIVLDIDPSGEKNSISLIDHPVLEGDAAELS
jgi:beta-galactosidase